MRRKDYQRIGEQCYRAKLDNGLPVCVVPKKGFARRYAFLGVNCGSVDTHFSQNGKTFVLPDGTAHYLEHKLFDMPDMDVMQCFSADGGSPNAFTGYAMSAYFFDCTENFEKNLQTLLKFVTTPYFTKESIEKERGIIAQEIRMYEDSADARVNENLFRALWRHHPVRAPISGTVQSIQSITEKTLCICHSAFYRPDNMLLCVVGDVEPQAVADCAQNLVARAEGRPPVTDYGEAEALRTEHPRTTDERMDIAMPTFCAGFRCDGGQNDPMQREFTGQLAAELLAGESSPLYNRLYEQGSIEADFGADFETIRNLQLLSVGGDTQEPELVIDAVLQEAERLCRQGVDPQLFARLKKSAIGRRTRALDSFENICYRMCVHYFSGSDYFRFPEAYDSINQEQLLAFLARNVRAERMAVSLLRPREKGENPHVL